jgi:CelD/BcsL family acetyltransferase involved in cellulose biosynthesis
MSGLALEWVGDRGRFAELREEWDGLLMRSGAALFNSWEWLYPWCQRVAPRAKLRILLVRNAAGALMGALPLVEERELTGRKLGFIAGHGVGSDDLDVLIDPWARESVLDAMAGALARERDWDVLHLSDVPHGDTAARGLVSRLLEVSSPEVSCSPEVSSPEVSSPEVSNTSSLGGQASWPAEVSNTSSSTLLAGSEERPRYQCPFISFPSGTEWDDVLRRSGRRDNVLRRRKWLLAQPGYAIRCIHEPVDSAVGIRTFLDLHLRRWAPRGGSQGIRGPWVEAFHRDAAWFLAERGALRLFFLELEGRPVAALYGMVHKRAFLFYQSGADPDFATRSVGLVLLAESIRAALEEGLERYEFLHGEEPYKLEWADSIRKTVTHIVWRRGVRARMARLEETLGRRLRTAAAQVLPQTAVARLRASRRAAPID